MFERKYAIKQDKMNNQAEFIKRIFRLTEWLANRYKVDATDVHFNYGWYGAQLSENKVTIKITFR